MGRTRFGNSVLSKQDSKTTDLSLTWVFLLQHMLNFPFYIDNGDLTLFLWGFYFCIFCVTGLFLPFSFSFENLHGKLTRGVHAQRLTAVINVYFSQVFTVLSGSPSKQIVLQIPLLNVTSIRYTTYLFILQLTDVLSCKYIRLTIKRNYLNNWIYTQ